MHNGLINVMASVLVTGVLLLTGCHSAPHLQSASIETRTSSGSLRIAFSSRDYELIEHYYEPSRYSNRKGLPPGLAKKGKIPPGHARRLHRKDSLPPGIAMQRLPRDLERRLSPIPDGYSRQKIGFNIVLIDNDTRLVVDVIHLSR